MGGDCHAKGKERGHWYEVQCVANDIKRKEARGEDAKYERSLLKSWSEYEGWEFASDVLATLKRSTYKRVKKLDKGETLIMIIPTPKKPLRKFHHRKNQLCPICKERLASSPHHIIPISEGGEDTRKNIVWLCEPCHNRIEENWEQWVDFFKFRVKRDLGNPHKEGSKQPKKSEAGRSGA